MSPALSKYRMLVLLLALASSLAGCALNNLPRIDPTGQRLLIFPGDPTPVATPLAGDTAPTLNPALASNLPVAPSNTVAPPVYTDPLLPGAPGSTYGRDLLGRQTITGPPVSSVAGTPLGGPIAVPTQPGERLTITPSRLLAPVGSEVILLGGVCAESGYLRTNERIEWMLDRKGTGQIVTVGNRGELDMFRLPQNTPRKVDNYFAISATSPFPQCLDRGTPNPSDDVQIRRGDAYITVSSPVEGTSYVTAYAPNVPNWAGRTASSVIYWIDAQWTFPPAVTLAPGESHTLTTTVTRQTDGAPIQGWIVRYTVAGGTAGLGYDQGQTAEATTNAQGRASVEITPTDNRPGTTNLTVEIVRPEQAGVASSPKVTLGSGATSITWADGGISGSPLPPSTLPPTTGAPSLPPLGGPIDSPSDGGFTPAPTPEPTPAPEGRPDLKVQIEQLSSGPFRVGDEVDYLITVTNQGDGIARNVKIVDEFDFGMSNDAAAPGENFIKTDTAFDLGPGESSEPLPLTFRLNQAGRLSHNVTVTADGAVPAPSRAFITVEGDPPPVAAPSLNIELAGPIRGTVGVPAEFEVAVTNVGPVPATNVVIVSDQDAELRPAQSSANDLLDVENFTRTGQMRWLVGTLQPNERRAIKYSCDCVAAVNSTCSTCRVLADGMTEPKSAQKCIEVRSQLGTPDNRTTPPATTPTGFDIQITAPPTPSVQERFLIFVQVRNNTGRVQENVTIRALVPPQLRADYGQVQASVSQSPESPAPWGEFGSAILLDPIPRMEPGATQRITIPVDAVSTGSARIIVDADSAELGNPLAREITLTVQQR